MTSKNHPTVSTAASSRLLALDAARAVAILGMVAVNVGPRDGASADLLARAAHGRASLLFVVLAGVGIALLTRHSWPAKPPRRGVLVSRGLILLLGGLALQLLDHGVNVILPTYGALFLVAVLMLQASQRTLVVSAVSALLGGPLLWIAAQCQEQFGRAAPELLDAPHHVAADICLSGPYPVITWVGPFLLGIWLGRLDLQDPRLHQNLALWGGSLAVGAYLLSRLLVAALGEPSDRVGFDRLISGVGHSQMPLWLISGTGSALFVIGVIFLLSPHLGRWSYPLASLGRLSLTVYVAHLLVLAFFVRPGPDTSEQGLLVTAIIGIVSIASASLWCTRFRRGPLEALLHAATQYGAKPDSTSSSDPNDQADQRAS